MTITIRSKAYAFVSECNFKAAHAQKFLYFLSLLTYNTYFKKLNAKILQSSLGKNNRKGKGFTYKTVIKTLLKNGVIECDFERIVSAKSYGYRLKKEYLDSNLVESQLKNENVISKIKEGKKKKFDSLPDHIRQMRANLAEITLDGKFVGEHSLTRRPIGRVFNLFTSTKREIRHRFLWKNAELLVEFDLSASQLYFLGIVVCEGLGFKTYNNNMPWDLREYLLLCSKGQIYEYFAQQLGIDINGEENRNLFKEKFYGEYFFNEDYNVLNNSEVGKVFKAKFPTIHFFILNNFIKKKITLASKLQKTESIFVIDKVYKQVYEKGIWAATIHDSVVCRQCHKDIVRQIFQEALSENITKALVKEKIWEGGIQSLNEGFAPAENHVLLEQENNKSLQEGGIPLEKERIGDTIKKDNINNNKKDNTSHHLTPINYVPVLICDTMVYPLNKKDLLYQQKEYQLLAGVDQLIRLNKPLSINQLNQLTQINKDTIRNHQNSLRGYYACATRKFDEDMLLDPCDDVDFFFGFDSGADLESYAQDNSLTQVPDFNCDEYARYTSEQIEFMLNLLKDNFSTKAA